eukprot:RCo048225
MTRKPSEKRRTRLPGLLLLSCVVGWAASFARNALTQRNVWCHVRTMHLNLRVSTADFPQIRASREQILQPFPRFFSFCDAPPPPSRLFPLKRNSYIFPDLQCGDRCKTASFVMQAFASLRVVKSSSGVLLV